MARKLSLNKIRLPSWEARYGWRKGLPAAVCCVYCTLYTVQCTLQVYWLVLAVATVCTVYTPTVYFIWGKTPTQPPTPLSLFLATGNTQKKMFSFFLLQCLPFSSTWYLKTCINGYLWIVNIDFRTYDGITSFHSAKLKDVENIFGQSQSYGRMSELWRRTQQKELSFATTFFFCQTNSFEPADNLYKSHL